MAQRELHIKFLFLAEKCPGSMRVQMYILSEFNILDFIQQIPYYNNSNICCPIF